MLTNRATRLEVSQGHQTWYRGTIWYVRYDFLLLVCYSNFVSKTRRFSDIWLQKTLWLWNLGHRSLKVIESGTIR